MDPVLFIATSCQRLTSRDLVGECVVTATDCMKKTAKTSSFTAKRRQIVRIGAGLGRIGQATDARHGVYRKTVFTRTNLPLLVVGMQLIVQNLWEIEAIWEEAQDNHTTISISYICVALPDRYAPGIPRREVETGLDRYYRI